MIIPWDIDYLYRALLIFLRLGALMFFIPLFSTSGVPPMVKAAFALLLTNLVAMVLPGHIALPTHLLGVVCAGINEILLGLFMGFVVKIAFETVSLAGELIAIQGGFMRDNSYDPFNQQSGGAMERLLFNFAIVVFLTTGMHLEIFSSFIKSFDVAPLGYWMPGNATMIALVAATSKIFIVAVQMAAPFIALNFIINMTFAVLGKAAPQVNVFMISFAVLIVGGLLMLNFTLDVIAQYVGQLMRESAGNMLLILQLK